MALARGHTEVARLLIEHGADLFSRDRSRMTPLQTAINYGQIQNAKLLINKGVSFNRNNLNLEFDPIKLSICSRRHLTLGIESSFLKKLSAYSTISVGMEVEICPLARELVQNESRTHPIIKTAARYAVKTLRICGVETPKRESPESPPKEAPKPEDLDSWMSTTSVKMTHRPRNKTIVR